MSAPFPLKFRWDGDAMLPLNPRAADRIYVVGEVYNLEHREDRSAASHARYFAALNEAWQNLPETMSDRFPDSETLRKYALVMTGFRDERSFVAASKAEAMRLAAFLRSIDGYAVVSIAGTSVVMFTARSQNMKAMGKADFQKSKDAVLAFIAELIGTNGETLAANAGRAA